MHRLTTSVLLALVRQAFGISDKGAPDIASSSSPELVQGGTVEFTRESTARFGKDGPLLRACPWYKFNEYGIPVMPRGPSRVGVPCRSQHIKASTDSFRNGGDFFVVKDGSELNAHVGGVHDAPNDMDLDAMTVSVVRKKETGGKSSFLYLNAHPSANTLVASNLILKRVKFTLSGNPESCMEAGGYGHQDLVPGEEIESYMEDNLCLCVADGVQAICGKTQKQTTVWQDGESFWMPLPNSKNLGRALETYVGLGAASWRDDTIDDLMSWDTNKDGRISLSEVLQLAPTKGVHADWLKVMEADDPCVIVNAQLDADFWLMMLKDIQSNPGRLGGELKTVGVYGDWKGKAEQYARQKYHGELLQDAAACKTMISASHKHG